MTSSLLLDTHIVVWWLSEWKRLSKDQLRAITSSLQRGEQLALSAATLLEIAVLGRREERIRMSVREILVQLDSNPDFRIFPLDIPIAVEIEAMGGSLRDPGDRAIVATARVHRLRLVTSDQRIIESNLMAVIE